MTVEILLPFWGDPGYAREAVRSVLDQDDPAWLLTVVDDAHPDEDLARWFADLAASDHRISYHRNARNLGVTGNFRAALARATAEYVTFLGSDDRLAPSYVRVMRAHIAAHPGIDAIQPAAVTIDGSGRVVAQLADRAKNRLFRPRVTRPTVLGGERLAASLLRGNWAYFPAYCFRRETVERHGFRDGFELVQDLALLVDLLLGGGRVLLVPETLFAYRRHARSASNADLLAGPRFAGEREYFALAERIVARRGWRRAARAARAHIGSRLHAASLLPAAVRGRDRDAMARLARHALGPSHS